MSDKRPVQIKLTYGPLATANRVNAQAVCDCGGTEFLVGIAVTARGNNFVRLIECTACRRQLQVVHHSNAELAPSIVS